MSKQLVLVFLGFAAAAVVAAVLVIQPPGRESGEAEPPPELRTEAPAEKAPQAARADRAPQAPPADSVSKAAPPTRQASREEFADWVLVCPDKGSGRGCLIGQNHVQAKTQRPIFAIQFRRSDDGGLEALLTTPLHVLLQPGIAFDIGQEEPITIEFSHCRGEQCQAGARLDDEAVSRLLTAQGAKATFKVASGQTAAIDISLNGFTEAFAALDQ